MGTPETHRMQEITKDLKTTSDKIRALDEAGFERADIARFLNKRYQHIRNVLVAPRPARRAAKQEAAQPRAFSLAANANSNLKARVQVGAGGRVVIPAEMRAAMGVSEGDMLLARVVDGELRLLSRQAAIRRAQRLVRQFVPEGVSLVDELIEERRAEARKESEE